MTQDEKNLNLLSAFHYVVGGLTALFSCFPLIHVVLGIMMITGGLSGKESPPLFFGWIFVTAGTLFIMGGIALAVAIIIAGRRLRARRSRTYCIVVAALECSMMPFGTILGIFTIVMLMKESVTELFNTDGSWGRGPIVGGTHAGGSWDESNVREQG